MMMLDLNLASSGESSAFQVKPLPEEDSGTSNSFVLNADASSNAPDEDSCSTRPVAGFQFGILKSSASVEGENLEEEIEEDGNGAGRGDADVGPGIPVPGWVPGEEMPMLGLGSRCRKGWVPGEEMPTLGLGSRCRKGGVGGARCWGFGG